MPLGWIFQCSCHAPLQPCAVTSCLTNLSMGFVLVDLAGAIRLLEKSLSMFIKRQHCPRAQVRFPGKPTRCGSCHIHLSAVSSCQPQVFWAPARWVGRSTGCPVKEEHDGHWWAHREQQPGFILLVLKLVNTLTQGYFLIRSSFILTREFLIWLHTPEEMPFYFTKGRWGIGFPVVFWTLVNYSP